MWQEISYKSGGRRRISPRAWFSAPQGKQVSVIDLHNPTNSDGRNFLTLVKHYVDITVKEPDNIAARAKAEKYAKILAKTIINPGGDEGSFGQNQYFYDSAEGLPTAVILLMAEFLPPKEIEGEMRERRHIVSVFKLVAGFAGAIQGG